MVICKYFPNCRYGDNCKFDHIYPSAQFSRDNTQQYYGNNSYFQHANRSSVPLKHTGNVMDLSEVMKVVIQEITQAEKGGQWPLSCFSPIKERPCFPGMQDYSPEEIRWRMYEANKNGTLAECQGQIKELYEEAKQKTNYLKNPNSEIYTIIDKYYVHKVDVSSGNTTFSVDSTKTQSNKFGFSTQSFGSNQHNAQTPISNTNFKFSLPQLQAGNVPQQQSMLRGGSNFQTLQLVNNQPSIFGGMGNPASTTQGFGSVSQNISSLQTVQQNAFGRVVTGNVFGNVGVDAVQGQSMNMFGATQTKSGSIFGAGATAQTQPGSIFGGAGTSQMPAVNNVFAVAAPSQGIFGESNVTSASNKVFGKGDPTSMPPTGIFGGSNTSTSSAFGTTNNTITHAEGAFGRPGTIPASNNTFGQVSAFGSLVGLSKLESNVLNSFLYTLKDELNREELSAFSANTFTLGKVPTRPPPKELCY